MILLSGRVRLSIINTYSPLGLDSCGNELTLVVLDHGYPNLFRNDLGGAHALTSRDRVNNVIIQPLKDFLLYHFLKGGVQSSLSISVRFGIVLKMYAVLYYSRTNAINVS